METIFSYRVLIILSIVLGLAPFYPQPHLVEKLRMLSQGTLSKPIDIFDLIWHIWPIFLLCGKLIKDYIL